MSFSFPSILPMESRIRLSVEIAFLCKEDLLDDDLMNEDADIMIDEGVYLFILNYDK